MSRYFVACRHHFTVIVHAMQTIEMFLIFVCVLIGIGLLLFVDTRKPAKFPPGNFIHGSSKSQLFSFQWGKSAKIIKNNDNNENIVIFKFVYGKKIKFR